MQMVTVFNVDVLLSVAIQMHGIMFLMVPAVANESFVVDHVLGEWTYCCALAIDCWNFVNFTRAGISFSIEISRPGFQFPCILTTIHEIPINKMQHLNIVLTIVLFFCRTRQGVVRNRSRSRSRVNNQQPRGRQIRGRSRSRVVRGRQGNLNRSNFHNQQL